MKSKNLYSWPIRRRDFRVAFSDPQTHYGILKYAIDFPLNEGTEILAVADGQVKYQKTDSKKGGDDPKYIADNNFISIEHSNGEFSEYTHLRYNGGTKKVGDKVKRGEIIGYSGNTGYSTEPHLHFHITKVDSSKEGWHTIEPRFEKKIDLQKSS